MKFLGYVFVCCILVGLGYAACYFGWFNLLINAVNGLIG